MRRRLWVLGALSLLALGAAGIASASQLGVNANGIGSFSEQRCTSATLATTVAGTPTGNNYTSVSIAAVPAACNGLPISITVYNASFTALATGTGTAATGTTAVTTTSYDATAATGVALVIDGWGVTTSWSAPAGPAVTCIPYTNGGNPQPSKTCTVTGVTYETPYDAGAAGQMSGVTINVSATSQSWRIVIDFTHPALGFNPNWMGQSFQTAAIDGTCTSPIGTIMLQPANGQTWGGYFNYTSIQAPGWWGGTTICP